MMQLLSKIKGRRNSNQNGGRAASLKTAAAELVVPPVNVRSYIVAYSQLLLQADQARRAGKSEAAAATFKRVFKSAIEQKEEAAMQEAVWGIIQASSTPKCLANGGLGDILKTAQRAAEVTVSSYFKGLMTKILEEREGGIRTALNTRYETIEKNKRFEQSFKRGNR